MGQAHTRAGCVHCACMSCMVHMYTHRGQPILSVKFFQDVYTCPLISGNP